MQARIEDLGDWLKTSVDRILMDYNIHANTKIFNNLIWQELERHVSKAKQRSDKTPDFSNIERTGFTLESKTLEFTLQKNLSMWQINEIYKFFDVKDRPSPTAPIEISQQKAMELLQIVKDRVSALSPNLLRSYQLASDIHFTYEAIEILKNNTKNIMKLLSQQLGDGKSLTPGEKEMIKLCGEFYNLIDTVLNKNKQYGVYTLVLAYQVKIKKCFESLQATNNQIERCIEQMDLGFEYFKKYNIPHYKSTIMGKKLFEDLMRDINHNYRIATNNCNALQHVFLTLAKSDDQIHLQQSNLRHSATINVGNYPSRLVFTFTNITDDNFSVILKYLQRYDETAIEGQGRGAANLTESMMVGFASKAPTENKEAKPRTRYIEVNAGSFLTNLYEPFINALKEMPDAVLRQYTHLSEDAFAKDEKQAAKKEEEKEEQLNDSEWLIHDIQEYLKPFGINRDTKIFNILVWRNIAKELGLKEEKKWGVSTGFTLRDDGTVLLFTLPNLDMDTIDRILTFLGVEDSRSYQPGTPIKVSKAVVEASLLPQFKKDFMAMKNDNPELYEFFRVQSNPFFTSSANSTLKDSVVRLIDILRERLSIGSLHSKENELFQLCRELHSLLFILLDEEKLYHVYLLVEPYEQAFRSLWDAHKTEPKIMRCLEELQLGNF